jgi:hypothetical protein
VSENHQTAADELNPQHGQTIQGDLIGTMSLNDIYNQL